MHSSPSAAPRPRSEELRGGRRLVGQRGDGVYRRRCSGGPAPLLRRPSRRRAAHERVLLDRRSLRQRHGGLPSAAKVASRPVPRAPRARRHRHHCHGNAVAQACAFRIPCLLVRADHICSHPAVSDGERPFRGRNGARKRWNSSSNTASRRGPRP